MPRTLLFVSSLLALGGIHTFSNAAELRSHSRDLQKRAEVHCGTWEIQCGGGGGGAIEDVCNKYGTPAAALRLVSPANIKKVPAISKII